MGTVSHKIISKMCFLYCISHFFKPISLSLSVPPSIHPSPSPLLTPADAASQFATESVHAWHLRVLLSNSTSSSSSSSSVVVDVVGGGGSRGALLR